MVKDPTAPRAIALETPDYIVRTLEQGDAHDAWRDWLSDTETARMLNARPQEMSADDVRKYIASFNRTSAHLLGIFEKTTGRLVGIRAVYVNWQRRDFLVNVLVGDRAARGKGARGQSRAAVYRYFFEDMDLATARATVVAENETVLAGMAKRGWLTDGAEQRTSAEGTGAVTIHRFRLPRDRWRDHAAAWAMRANPPTQ
jgi:RimJ/RimL family protein N-acetyltransferase